MCKVFKNARKYRFSCWDFIRPPVWGYTAPFCRSWGYAGHTGLPGDLCYLWRASWISSPGSGPAPADTGSWRRSKDKNSHQEHRFFWENSSWFRLNGSLHYEGISIRAKCRLDCWALKWPWSDFQIKQMRPKLNMSNCCTRGRQHCPVFDFSRHILAFRRPADPRRTITDAFPAGLPCYLIFKCLNPRATSRYQCLFIGFLLISQKPQQKSQILLCGCPVASL